MKITSEQLKMAKSCKTAEELVAKAQDAGVTLSLEQAQSVLDSVTMVELSEDDVDNVSGGNTVSAHADPNYRPYRYLDGATCPECGSKNTTIWAIGRFYDKPEQRTYECHQCGKQFDIWA